MVQFSSHFDGRVIMPDEPVEIPVNAPLHISVEPAPKQPQPDAGLAWVDGDAHRLAEREPQPEISLEEIRAELAQHPGSWADDVIAERGEY